MKDRIKALFLAVIMLASQLGIPVHAEEQQVVSIHDAGEFLLMAEQCRTESFSTGKIFRLENDIDLSGQENLSVPVMDGIFDGNGCQITGISLTEEMSDYGLFRYVGPNGIIRDLTVEAGIVGEEGQENIGIIAGSNKGVIEGCTSRGSLSAQHAVGGIAGYNEATGTIRRCVNEAQVDGKDATGGITGYSEGIVEDCTNTGSVNTSQKVLGEMSGDGSVTISIPNAVAGLTSDERANETGGIAGFSSGSISYCKNEGTVGHEHLGFAVGGIVGRQSGAVSYSSNTGIVYGRKNTGGIVGYFDPYEAVAYDRDIGEELEEQLDELSDLADSLSDSARTLGDHLSSNMDDLSDKMKALKNSLRSHLDDFEDLADDSRDSIRDQVSDVKKTMDDVSFTFGLEKMKAHIQQIEKDMGQIQTILEQLKPMMEAAGGEMQEELEQTIAQYQDELDHLRQQIKALMDYIENLPASGDPEDNETPDTSGTESSDPTEASEEESSETTEASEPEASEPEASETEPSEPEITEPEESEAESVPEASESEPEVHTMEGMSPSASSGVMQPAAFTKVALTDEQTVQLAAAMQKLQALSDDIQVQMKGIMEILGGVPGEAEKLHDNFQNLSKDLKKLADTLDDEMDDWDDELSSMKDDLQGHSDRISGSLDTVGDTLDADWDVVQDRLDQVKDKFSDIRGTISDGFDELKNSLEEKSIYVDISDLAERTPGNGRVIGCRNEGEVFSDTQAGGIVGSILKEGTKDATGWIFDYATSADDEDDEDSKDSITKHIMAAIMDCKNTGQISVKNDYAGGIVGRAEYGSAFSCENYGDIVSDDGSYVGGIAGKSRHAIVDSYVLCGLDGASYVGGVAGRGEDISGSVTCVYMDMDEYVKSTGAIAGKADGSIEKNYFVDNGCGAVDGVTRSSEAEGMDYETILTLEALPLDFTRFTVRFVNGEETLWEGTFSYGDELPEENYPELQELPGEYAYWEEKDVSPVRRNVTLHAVYRAYVPSLSSGEDENHPNVLMGGEFYPDSTLAVREATEEELNSIRDSMEDLGMLPRYHIKQVFCYEIDQEEALRPDVTLRVIDNTHLADSMLTMNESFEEVGAVQKTENVGSYLSVNTSISQKGYVIVTDRIDAWVSVVGTIAVIIACVLILFGIDRWKKRHWNKKGEKKENSEEKDA